MPSHDATCINGVRRRARERISEEMLLFYFRCMTVIETNILLPYIVLAMKIFEYHEWSESHMGAMYVQSFLTNCFIAT
jgi:hypothetical protein